MYCMCIMTIHPCSYKEATLLTLPTVRQPLAAAIRSSVLEMRNVSPQSKGDPKEGARQ